MLARIEIGDAALVVRGMVTADAPFIFSSWLKSYRVGSALARDVVRPVYFAQHHRMVERLLARGRVLVAADAEGPQNILGYAVGEHIGPVAVVHYLYVKAPFRGIGIGQTLAQVMVSGLECVHHTHATPLGQSLVRRLQSVFNPYLAH